MLLREDRVRNLDVLVLHAGVAQHEPDFVAALEQMLEGASHVLDCSRVAGGGIQRCPGRLDPYPTYELASMAIEQRHDLVEKGDRMVAFAAAGTQKASDVLALHLREDVVEMMPSAGRFSAEEPTLQLEEIPGQPRNLVGI